MKSVIDSLLKIKYKIVTRLLILTIKYICTEDNIFKIIIMLLELLFKIYYNIYGFKRIIVIFCYMIWYWMWKLFESEKCSTIIIKIKSDPYKRNIAFQNIGLLFFISIWKTSNHPPPLTSSSRNAAALVPTVKNSRTAHWVYRRTAILAFLSLQVKGITP